MAAVQSAFLNGVGKIHVLLLDGFTDQRFVLAIVVACTLVSLLRIRSLAAPLIKLAVVYYMAFIVALAAMYGPEDVLNMTSLKHLRRTAKAAIVATAICFFTGMLTPKKVRQGAKA
jgi:hypothetical protein